MSDLAVLDVVPTETEAEIVCVFLRSEGIPALHRQTTMGGGATGGMPAGGPREILVRSEQLERARGALEQQERSRR